MGIHQAFPGVQVDWAVDSSCADVVRLNRGVSRVLCAPLRHFKRAPNAGDLQSIATSIVALRSYRYDAVMDLHGVYKSAIIAFLARSPQRFGYQDQDLGELGARFAYHRHFGSRPRCDAWHGMRVSAGQALGYEPRGAANYDLSIPHDGCEPPGCEEAREVMFVHASSNDEKKWPTQHWVKLAREMRAAGLRVVLPWGTAAERDEAQQIAARSPGAVVLPSLSIRDLACRIDRAAMVVGVDMGLVHQAHALGKPSVMIFRATSRHHCGIAGTPHSLPLVITRRTGRDPDRRGGSCRGSSGVSKDRRASPIR